MPTRLPSSESKADKAEFARLNIALFMQTKSTSSILAYFSKILFCAIAANAQAIIAIVIINRFIFLDF